MAYDKVIDDFKNTSPVVVMGDAFADVWMTARQDRMSAEAEIPIWDIQSTRHQPGGAANVGLALSNLGLDTIKYFNYEPGSVPIKTRILVEGRQVARIDQFDQCWPYKGAIDALKDNLVVVSDYGKGAINAREVEDIAHRASEIWINTKFPQPNYECLDMARPSTQGPTVTWLCNEAEYNKDKDWYARQLRVWVSRGPGGITYYYDGKPWPAASRKAEAKTVVSVCGAGDVVLAALVRAQLSGCDPEYMARYAMTAAAIAVEHPFTYCPTIEEIDDRRYE